jgi:hypothetical protein
MMNNNFYNVEQRSEWSSNKDQWNNDLVKYMDNTGMGIYVTADKYHLKSRVIRGTRRKHMQETQFNKYITEIFHRIGLKGADGYSSPEELVHTFQHVINKYYLTTPTNAIDVLATHKENDTIHRSTMARRIASYNADDMNGNYTDTDTSSSNNKKIIEYIRGDRWNEHKCVTEYYVKYSGNDKPVWCEAPGNIYDHIEFAQYVFRKAEARQPILNKHGFIALQRMIDNVEYIWNIQLLRNMYPELSRNSGTNLLESFHSVWNSTSVSKGSVSFTRRRMQLHIRVWQRNTHYLFAILDRAKKGSTELDNRHKELEQSLRELYTLQDNMYPSHNWLPINGPPSNVIWLPWKENVHKAEELAQMGYKLHRSLRLGDLYAIDITSMMYEISK